MKMKPMKKCTFIFLLLTVLLVASCNRQRWTERKIIETDSLMFAAGKTGNYQRVLQLTDSLEKAGDINSINANRWRGVAYYYLGQMRPAEFYYQKVVDANVKSENDQLNYNKSARRLSSLLVQKGDYEGALRVALPAVNKIRESSRGSENDIAVLLNTIGCCQLHLGRDKEAAASLEESYQTFMHILSVDSTARHFHFASEGVSYAIEEYLAAGQYEEAARWIERLEQLLGRYKLLPGTDASAQLSVGSRIQCYRAIALQGQGNSAEAAAAYRSALGNLFSKTTKGRLLGNEYLLAARRFGEAANSFRDLDQQLSEEGIPLTLDNIRQYLLPKFRANVGAGRSDSAVAVGVQICQALDSAIVRAKKDDAAELATMYNSQQKDAQIAEQKAQLKQQQFVATAVAMVLLTIFFVVYTLHRRKSARHLAEAHSKLQTAYEKLEDTSAQLERNNEQLTLANARAEESSKMKTDFIQQISHEIRTPLNILSGFTQILTTPGMQLDEATQQDINRQISDATNRITGLVNKMLELSDAGSKQVIDRTDDVSPVQIAAQAAEDSGINNATHLTFDLQIDDAAAAGMVRTHLSSATRALTLLLDNAAKFTRPAEALQPITPTDKKASVVLRVSMTGAQLLFVVEDTGIGVPASEAEHIFEEFVQLDNYYDGTGIGLTVARSLARRLGGDIVLDTSYAPGARFVLTLPV